MKVRVLPLLHGTLFYTDMQVLPPVVVAGADRLTADDATEAAARLRARLNRCATDAPTAFRSQDGGDHDDDLVLPGPGAGPRRSRGARQRTRA